MIATATFRLHPLPEVSETLLIKNQSASDLRNLMAEMKRMQLEAAAVIAIAAITYAIVAPPVPAATPQQESSALSGP